MINEKVKQAISKITFDFEALSIYPLSWNITESAIVPTLGTDYKTLEYNPKFVESLTLQEVVAVLLHEVFHCVFLHPGRVDRNFSEGKNLFVWKMALEQVTNAEVIQVTNGKGYSLPGKPVDPRKIVQGYMGTGYVYTPDFKDLNEIEVYNELMKFYNEQSCDGAGSSLILTGDVKDSGNLSAEETQEAIEKAIATIKKMQKHGLTSSKLERLLKHLTTSRIPWKRVLASFVSRVVEGHDEFSFCKPNVKHPLADEIIIPDTISRHVDEPVVVVDTSGSIDNKTLREFASGIVAMLKGVVESAVVITTDAEVHEVVKVSSIQDILNGIKFCGGGGTDFRPVFDKIKKCDFMVFFTDGYATYPSQAPRYPVLWIMTKEHNKPPFGKVAYILEN